MADQNIIVINGNEFSFEPGESILDIARRNSIDIPTLCHLKGASPTGACRVCVVEVEGARAVTVVRVGGVGRHTHRRHDQAVALRIRGRGAEVEILTLIHSLGADRCQHRR